MPSPLAGEDWGEGLRTMSHQEGVIKFQLDYSPGAALSWTRVWDLNAWRKILFLNGMIGIDPSRYEGFGFGNVSMRLDPTDAAGHQTPFTISGSQTQDRVDLTPEHYAIVTSCDTAKNRIVAHGPIQPSSEALTHGAVYELDPAIRFVMHVHCPAIWKKAKTLQIPMTDHKALYGTPEMATAVKQLYQDGLIQSKHIFAMGGHEDGVVSFGPSSADAGILLLSHLFKAV